MTRLTVDASLIQSALDELRREVCIENIPQRRRAPILELQGALERAYAQVQEERQAGTVERPAVTCQPCGICVSQCPECGVRMEATTVTETLPPVYTCTEAGCHNVIFDNPQGLEDHRECYHPEWEPCMWSDPARLAYWRCGYRNRSGERCSRRVYHNTRHRSRPFVCQVCRIDYATQQMFGQHVDAYHEGDERAPHTLYFCDASSCPSMFFPLVEQWVEHRELHRPLSLSTDNPRAFRATLDEAQVRYQTGAFPPDYYMLTTN